MGSPLASVLFFEKKASFLDAKLWRETVRGETTREENSFFSEHTWITFIHLEKSSPCQLIPHSSKGWKSQ
jgi:hypothetical protein